MCVCVRALTPFLSFIPPIVHLHILLSILLLAVCTLCPQPLCPAATFAARRSKREALSARQAQHREDRRGDRHGDRHQPRGDHRPGGKLQEERERQKQR